MTTISESTPITPITTIQEAFEAAILTAPGDHTPRLVYADWLEEHDEPESAAYLRASVRRLIARAEEAKRKAKEARAEVPGRPQGGRPGRGPSVSRPHRGSLPEQAR